MKDKARKPTTTPGSEPPLAEGPELRLGHELWKINQTLDYPGHR